jgi:hypothetical protein
VHVTRCGDYAAGQRLSLRARDAWASRAPKTT